MDSRIMLYLLCWSLTLSSITLAAEEIVELKLIAEQQMDISDREQDIALVNGRIAFVGDPEYIAPGQAKFAPIFIAGVKGNKNVLRVDGRDIPCENRCIYYDPEKEFLAQVKQEPLPGEAGVGTFIVQRYDGRVLWQVKHRFLAEARVSEKGTVILVCNDEVNGTPGVSGVYVYDLYNGKLITAFEDPKLIIFVYKFSGDGNRVIFEHKIYQHPPPRDPRVNFACIDATGELLWNLKMEHKSRLSVSYSGDLILYETAIPSELLEKKSSPQLGLMDGNGRVLWEVDNAARGAQILPSGKYYSVALYADQSRVWEPTTKQEPLSRGLFETLTHKEARRGTSDELAVLPTEDWVLVAGTGWPLDDGLQALAFSEKGYQQKDSGPVRSLLVVNDYLTREIMYQKEFTGIIVKVLASQDLKVIQLIFWDGRWMLFERIP